MYKFNLEEPEKIFQLLERAGMNPMWCDTPVPYFDVNVPAGIPMELGDTMQGEYLMLPASIATMNPTVVLNVRGDSMKDAGIADHDRIEVRLTPCVNDGDIVVAEVDGECTVKNFFTDEQGDHWLVPSNEVYTPIRLTDEMRVRIVGVVTGILRNTPRTSYNECLKSIRRAREQQGGGVPSQRKVENAIVRVATEVRNGRQWYAVYRALVDKGAYADGAYTDFCDTVARLVSGHDHLPSASELRRLSVQSFRKPVSLWERSDAPVSGSRFDEYLRIARMTAGALTGQ